MIPIEIHISTETFGGLCISFSIKYDIKDVLSPLLVLYRASSKVNFKLNQIQGKAGKI